MGFYNNVQYAESTKTYMELRSFLYFGPLVSSLLRPPVCNLEINHSVRSEERGDGQRSRGRGKYRCLIRGYDLLHIKKGVTNSWNIRQSACEPGPAHSGTNGGFFRGKNSLVLHILINKTMREQDSTNNCSFSIHKFYSLFKQIKCMIKH